MAEPLKITFLDCLPLNPGDLDWAPLRALGGLVLHEHSRPDQVIGRIIDSDIVLTNKVKVDVAAIEAATNLKMISVTATGYDCVDRDAARLRGVTVCNVPSYSADFTAQTAVALLLELTHHAGSHAEEVRAGRWSAGTAFSFWSHPLVELAGKTAVIVGLGNIGGRVAKTLDAMGMNVVAAVLPGRAASDSSHFPRVALDNALRQADVVSLHCPLTPETRALINADRLSRMKSTALIVNASRGALIDEDAVLAALAEGRLGGYAADVMQVEPPPADHPLLHAPRTVITPHLGWASIECRSRLLDVTVANVKAYLDGKPRNVVV
jgi:glycerate dehydrogenase